MEEVTWFEVLSLLASLASLVLALVAIWFARATEKEARANYQRTKDVLGEIDKRAAVIETTVSESQRQLLDTMTNILNETVIPKKQDVGEMLGAQLIQALIPAMTQNPAKLKELMETVESFKTRQSPKGG